MVPTNSKSHSQHSVLTVKSTSAVQDTTKSYNTSAQLRTDETRGATTHMDIHPPRGKTGAGWKHTNTQSISKY